MNIRSRIVDFILSLFLFTAILYITDRNNGEEKEEVKIEAETIDIERENFISVIHKIDSIGKEEINEENIYKVFYLTGMQHSDIVFAQMSIESGHFKSRLSKSNNNFFGMKHPGKRINVSLGKKRGYARYKNWAYSVLDYRLWQSEYANDLSTNEYLKKLSSYAEDKNYLSKIEKFI